MKCRHCMTPLWDVFIDLGSQPPSNSFLTKEQLGQAEPVYPLKVFTCPGCFLVQIDEHKDATEIFNHSYVYFSSYSSAWLAHARKYTEMVVDRFNLDDQSLVVEVASNDGYLLQYMKGRGIPCYGVEPSTATAEVAVGKGIESVTEFFGKDLAVSLAEARGKADLLIGNNVLAHVPDINDFVTGLKALLKRDGVITMEFPHLMRLVEDCLFDTIYHEHFSYLSLGTVTHIFNTCGLDIFDVEELSDHGGSLRVFATHSGSDVHGTTSAVDELLDQEAQAGMKSLVYYEGFQTRVDTVKNGMLEFLKAQREAGSKVMAYGAAAKGNTLLNYCGVDRSLIDFCVDASPHKQGLFMPGSHLPILAPEAIKEHEPEFVIILPWNLKDEISAQHEYIAQWGGRFVVPIPEVVVFPCAQ